MSKRVRWQRVIAVTALLGLFGRTTANAGYRPHNLGETACVPLRILLAQDKSQSAPVFRTTQVTNADVDALTEIIKANCGGGELAVTIIRETSPRPLARLRIIPPPTAPQAPSKSGNIFRNSIARQQYEAELKKYEKSRANWEADFSSRLAAFRAQVTPLLAQAADGPRTDLLSALARSAAFFHEPAENRNIPPRQFLVLVSDCEGNVPGQARLLPSDVTTLVVNGFGNTGSLSSLGITPIAFEAFTPAVNYIAQERR